MPRPTPPLAPGDEHDLRVAGPVARAAHRHDRPQSACTTVPVRPSGVGLEAGAARRRRASSSTEPGKAGQRRGGSTTGAAGEPGRGRDGVDPHAARPLGAGQRPGRAPPPRRRRRDSGAQPAQSSGAGRSTTATMTPPSAQRTLATPKAATQRARATSRPCQPGVEPDLGERRPRTGRRPTGRPRCGAPAGPASARMRHCLEGLGPGPVDVGRRRRRAGPRAGAERAGQVGDARGGPLPSSRTPLMTAAPRRRGRRRCARRPRPRPRR